MQTTVVLCDLDDGEERPGVATVQLTVQGVTYDLDVCQEHLDALRRLPVVDGDPRREASRATRKKAPAPRASRSAAATSTARGGSQRRPGSRRSRQERIAQARAWARAQGREVANRGRLPVGLLEEFEAAQG